MDTRALGGYVLAAGSVNATGIRYRITSAQGQKPAPAPEALLDQLDVTAGGSSPVVPVHATAYAAAALRAETALVRAATVGRRNATVFTAALKLGRFVTSGELSAELVKAELHNACRRHIATAGFTRTEARRAIANGLRYGGDRDQRSH